MEELRSTEVAGKQEPAITNDKATMQGGRARGASQVSERRVVHGMPALTKTLSGRSVPISSRDHAGEIVTSLCRSSLANADPLESPGMTEVVRTLTQQSRAEQAKKGDAEAQNGLPLDANGNFDLEQFLKDSMGTDEKGRANVPREMSVAWKVSGDVASGRLGAATDNPLPLLSTSPSLVSVRAPNLARRWAQSSWRPST